MRTIQSKVTINQPKDKVWAILSDLTAMRNYMPGIQSVRFTSESKRGVGTARHCIFDDGVELHEKVYQWDEGNGYTLETTQFVKVPMKSNQITFSLTSDGDKTIVSQSMQYQMKGGLIAPLMERFATGMMKKALDGALQGLKQYAETSS